jgi:hypothetical protein
MLKCCWYANIAVTVSFFSPSVQYGSLLQLRDDRLATARTAHTASTFRILGSQFKHHFSLFFQTQSVKIQTLEQQAEVGLIAAVSLQEGNI